MCPFPEDGDMDVMLHKDGKPAMGHDTICKCSWMARQVYGG